MALSADVQSTDHWLRKLYSEIDDIREILFAPGQTAKGAKRLLRNKRKHWHSRITQPEPTAAPGDSLIYADWYNQLNSYWPGLFYCFADPRIPGTNVEMERFIKRMKQHERAISRSPNPSVRFTRHAAINAIVITRPDLPGAQFLAGRSAADLQVATATLKEQQRSRGIGYLARRDLSRFEELIVATWKDACQLLDTVDPRSESR